MISSLLLVAGIAFPPEHAERLRAEYGDFGKLWDHIRSLPEERLDPHQDGWLWVQESGLPTPVMWIFPSVEHPAFPSAARLEFNVEGGAIKSVTGAVLCYIESIESCALFKEAVDRQVLELALRTEQK